MATVDQEFGEHNSKEQHPKKKKNKKPPPAKKIRPRIPILQYHNDWVCVNKPAQMSVHRGGRRDSFVVAALLKRQLSRKVWPVHRLDHRTSGCLLFAFSSEVCGQLHASLTSKDDDAVKDYIALVRGDWSNLPGTLFVDRPLTVDEVQKEAKTEFQLLATIETTTNDENDEYQGACSLVRCRLLTGRKHQIRRHAYAIGHPVLGDTEHGDSRVNRWWRQNRGLNRLFLHSISLDLPPLQNNDNKPRIQCVAPLPEELSSVMKRPDMQALWGVAVKKDPRLAQDPYDETGGTLGKGAKKKPLEEETKA